LDLDLECKPALGFPERTCGDFLARYIAEFDPAVVGVTSMYNNSLQAQRLVQRVKQVSSAIVTVCGGSHFGALGVQSLRRIPELDYVIEGEAELAFASLLDALAERGGLTDSAFVLPTSRRIKAQSPRPSPEPERVAPYVDDGSKLSPAPPVRRDDPAAKSAQAHVH
jgi:radical SAM superfamily enzyme YgiQ (UPF0313 family)